MGSLSCLIMFVLILICHVKALCVHAMHTYIHSGGAGDRVLVSNKGAKEGGRRRVQILEVLYALLTSPQ